MPQQSTNKVPSFCIVCWIHPSNPSPEAGINANSLRSRLMLSTNGSSQPLPLYARIDAFMLTGLRLAIEQPAMVGPTHQPPAVLSPDLATSTGNSATPQYTIDGEVDRPEILRCAFSTR
ncbi:hypothetical protein FALBO_13375 [Fusarium albosuccineum]|uniref:Uncharacterized protein n=1 Tax=Fusarium albosuccineum TaxID=1237068 RepID=A0A8H4L287_9HYPO|nr:hypothetical protein FALBO_13375 [Fusarium albosuccineum]